MLISGSIGITILENNNKIIILLADDHSNTVYCDNNSLDYHIDIKDFLKKELDNEQQILLEEIPRDGFNLQELWPNSPHTQNLKNLFLNNKEINGIDIRPYLLPFSWDNLEIDSTPELSEYSIIKYISKLNDFFKLEGDFYNNIFYPIMKKVIIYNNGLGKNLIHIKDKFIKLRKEIYQLDKPIKYYFNNKRYILEEISNICDEIMEFNTLLNVFTTNKKSIIHAGLFHSFNMLTWLINSYNFKVLYKNGINQFPPNESRNDIKACVYVPINVPSNNKS
jgi:hypothetical protein